MNWHVINKSIKVCESRYSDPYDIIKCLKGLISKYGRDGMILYRIGLWYEELGFYNKALEYYSEAMERFPLEKFKNMAKECYERAKLRIMEENGERKVHIVSMNVPTIIVDKDTLFVVNCTKTKIWNIAKKIRV